MTPTRTTPRNGGALTSTDITIGTGRPTAAAAVAEQPAAAIGAAGPRPTRRGARLQALVAAVVAARMPQAFVALYRALYRGRAIRIVAAVIGVVLTAGAVGAARSGDYGGIPTGAWWVLVGVLGAAVVETIADAVTTTGQQRACRMCRSAVSCAGPAQSAPPTTQATT